MGVLYVVATPIGNLEDITLRALRVLKEVGLIAAEDTRTTRKLLGHYGIETPMTSYHEHNRAAKIPQLVEALQTLDVALVSEAGTPAISDPGRELVASAIEAGIRVVPVPGPSAVTSALAASGLPNRQFLYVGFLPRRRGERRRLLESLKGLDAALVAFEAPHRIRSSLQDIADLLGDRELAVCRELTKVHEEIFRGTASQALVRFSEPRGEFTLVIGPPPEGQASTDPELARDQLARLKEQGLSARESVAVVAEATGIPRRELYRLWLDL